MWILYTWYDYDNVYCDPKLQKGYEQAASSSITRESLSLYWLQTNLASIQKYKGTIKIQLPVKMLVKLALVVILIPGIRFQVSVTDNPSRIEE